MNFTSFHFVIFFFVTILIGHMLKNRARRVFLLLASLYFYGAFEPWYLILVAFSTGWDFLAGLGIETRRSMDQGSPPPGRWFRVLAVLRPRTWLVLSLFTNLGLLAYFKYTNFGIEVLNDIQPLGDTVFAWPATYILLPVGISFYTFQSLSYTIDVYRGIARPRESLVDFALYVTFFPQLVAGPIVRATTFFDRLDDPVPVTHNDIVIGFTRIVVGLFRKLALSDNLVPAVNGVFGEFARKEPSLLGPLDVWVGAVAFGWQIYLDFAGYTDIARGVARLFGYEFEINFLYPMAARNISDHWRRWHISFGTWIRDYIYIPLGGSRGSPPRIYFNLLVTWLFGGVWHGPAYHFVAWGVWQGVMLGIHREWTRTRIHGFLHARTGALAVAYGVFARVFLKFNLVFGFIWFRAETMTQATRMQGRLFGAYDLSGAWASFRSWALGDGALETAQVALRLPAGATFLPGQYTPYLALLVLYYLYEYVFNHLQLEYFWKEENRTKLILVLSTMILAVLIFSSPETPNFMYFQF